MYPVVMAMNNNGINDSVSNIPQYMTNGNFISNNNN